MKGLFTDLRLMSRELTMDAETEMCNNEGGAVSTSLRLKGQRENTVLPEPPENWNHERIAVWWDLRLWRRADISSKQGRSREKCPEPSIPSCQSLTGASLWSFGKEIPRSASPGTVRKRKAKNKTGIKQNTIEKKPTQQFSKICLPLCVPYYGFLLTCFQTFVHAVLSAWYIFFLS